MQVWRTFLSIKAQIQGMEVCAVSQFTAEFLNMQPAIALRTIHIFNQLRCFPFAGDGAVSDAPSGMPRLPKHVLRGSSIALLGTEARLGIDN